jgi:dTDP-3-amino-3,4,6-trideoxy-alpha-D-glucose transaminase
LQAVLFDWDGTLVDSAQASYRCYVRLFSHYGIRFDEESFERTYSPNWHRTYEQLGLPRAVWEEADRRWLEHYSGEETSLLPGARETLERVRQAGLRVALVTSGDRQRVSGELARLGLTGAFEVTTCADDAPQRKPHPASLLLTLDRMGRAPSAAAYVGDSPEDVEMARAAGAYAVGVFGGFPNRGALEAAEPDLLVSDLVAATDLLLGGSAGPAAPPPSARPPGVPLVDLRAHHQRLRPEIDAAVARVLDSGRFIGGEECEALEREFAAYCGVAHAYGVANGTDALALALRALGIGPGDDVLVPDFTFVGTAEAVLLAGARPVLVDVDPATFTMDPARTEEAITPRTRAVIPVHLYGHPADMNAFGEIARRRGLFLIEDAAQAHGAEIAGRRVGSFGHLACFSFYPSKNLGALGDAGMVVSDDGDLLRRLRQIANHGAGEHKYDNVVPGTNSRLDALQAAVLRIKLRQLDGWNRERRERAVAYDRELAGLGGLALPREAPGMRSSWYLYTVRTPRRDALRAHLLTQGIETAVHYPRPLHLQPALSGAAPARDLSVSERLAGEVLSLPLFPELPFESLRRVGSAIRTFEPV